MSENTTDNKLGTRLVPEKITKTSTRFRLKFTDYATEQFTSDFQKVNKNGEIIGDYYRKYTPQS